MGLTDFYLFEASTKKLVSNSSQPAMKPTVTKIIPCYGLRVDTLLTSQEHNGETQEKCPDSDGPRSIWNLNDEDDGFYHWIYMSSNWLHNSFPELAFSLMLTK